MRPNVEEVTDADPAAELAAEEENKLINEVHTDYPQVNGGGVLTRRAGIQDMVRTSDSALAPRRITPVP